MTGGHDGGGGLVDSVSASMKAPSDLEPPEPPLTVANGATAQSITPPPTSLRFGHLPLHLRSRGRNRCTRLVSLRFGHLPLHLRSRGRNGASVGLALQDA